jgi:hypothetical protein
MAPVDNSSLDEVDYGAGFSNFLRTFLAVSLRGVCVRVNAVTASGGRHREPEHSSTVTEELWAREALGHDVGTVVT